MSWRAACGWLSCRDAGGGGVVRLAGRLHGCVASWRVGTPPLAALLLPASALPEGAITVGRDAGEMAAHVAMAQSAVVSRRHTQAGAHQLDSLEVVCDDPRLRAPAAAGSGRAVALLLLPAPHSA
jgi:hypothetical protein